MSDKKKIKKVSSTKELHGIQCPFQRGCQTTNTTKGNRIIAVNRWFWGRMLKISWSAKKTNQ